MHNLQIIKNIQLLVFDFDGVFTNNKVIVSESGEESVICDRSDGIGLAMLRSLGIEMIILSTESNKVVTKRAEKLKIQCRQGIPDKLVELHSIAMEYNISLDRMAYLGNDINDLDCLKAVGLPVVVADAYPQVKEIATLILKKNGGDGAVREFCEFLYLNFTAENA